MNMSKVNPKLKLISTRIQSVILVAFSFGDSWHAKKLQSCEPKMAVLWNGMRILQIQSGEMIGK